MRRFNGLGRILAALVLSGLFSLGCDRTPQASAPPQAPAPEVAVMEISTQPLMLLTELPGRTSAFRTAEIRPQVSGLILKRLFTEGAAVEKGQMLYQIDPAPYEAAADNARAGLLGMEKSVDRTRASLKAVMADLNRYEATLDLARTNMERYETLFEKNAVSALQRDQAATDAKTAQEAYEAALAQVDVNKSAVAEAEAGIQKAEAALKTARINLAYTAITAPISGRIGRSAITEGAMVTAYQALALATIQQTDPIYVDVPQSTTEVLRLRKRLEQGRLNRNGQGQNKVSLLLEDGTDYALEGDLEFQDITVDPSTGSVILRAVFPNPDHLLLPGMFVRARIKEGVNEQAILIPQQAVARDPRGNPVVMTLDKNNKVAAKMIGIDRAVNDQWLVSTGLAPGDRLIVEGLQKVRPGVTAKAVPAQGGNTGTAGDKAKGDN